VKLVLASANAGKQREFAALLAPLGIELVMQSELGVASAEETGKSFEANALLKARHAARITGLAALADDSGLEVDVLDGRPGVYSARFAGPQASDADNNALLLAQMAEVPEFVRVARYRCALALVRSAQDPAPLLAVGSWEGAIAFAPAGSNGFGYDALFLPEGHEQTAAELPSALKNTLSHRAQALAALLEQLRRSPLA